MPTVISTAKQPKETDSVLLRVPTALRELAAKEASEIDVSQNAFITNSLLFGVLVFGERKYVGHPKNLLSLVDEIDRAFKGQDAALSAFHAQDWREVSNIVDILVKCDVLANLKVRPDSKVSETIVFSFTLTKNGRASWPGLKSVMEMVAKQISQQEPLLGSAPV
jgi:hypothetical protein